MNDEVMHEREKEKEWELVWEGVTVLDQKSKVKNGDKFLSVNADEESLGLWESLVRKKPV